MDVAADDAVETARGGGSSRFGQRFFEAVDRFDGFFDLAFQPGGQRPVRAARDGGGRY